MVSDMILTVKTIKYTRHARNRMRLHEVTEAEVELAIQKPKHLEPSVEGRFNAWIETSGKFLRVTYKEEKNRFLIISAVKKRKGWG
jgi:hypothetical protein